MPKETLIWQDPVPAVDHPLIDEQDIAALKAKILASGLSVPQLVSTAWASASTFRGSDKRGGANGARIRLAPQKDWEVNQPGRAGEGAGEARGDPEGVQRLGKGRQEGLARRPDRARRRRGVEQAAKDAGIDVKVPFTPGRTDASQEQTDVESFAPLEPGADGFRNYIAAPSSSWRPRRLLVDRAQLLTLTAPEMTVLVGGLRVLDANAGRLEARRVHRAARDADQRLLRQPARHGHGVEAVDGRRRASSKAATARRARSSGPRTRVDLSSARTRSCARWPRSTRAADAQEKFVKDFVAAWAKVMNLDRFDLVYRSEPALKIAAE